jgi:hypothetical protein
MEKNMGVEPKEDQDLSMEGDSMGELQATFKLDKERGL